MRQLHLISFYFISFAFLLVQHPSFIQAQENDIGRVTGNRLYQFDKKDMTPIGVGHLVSIGKKTVSVKLSSGKKTSLEINQLSKKDTDRLKYFKKELQAIAKSRSAAEKLENRLLKDDAKTQIKVCRQLRSLEVSTNNQLSVLVRIVKESKNPELVYEALMAFAETCNTSKENLEFILDRGARKHQRSIPQIKFDPKDFILALSRWNALSIDYLKQFAFSGDLILPPDADFLSKPITLPPSDAIRTKVRTYASVSIGLTQISFPETYYTTVPLLLTILSSAEASINGQFDKDSVRSIILAIGRHGMNSNVFEKYERTFPEEVKFASKLLIENKKILQECKRLYSCTRHQFYFSKSNKDFLWGRIESQIGDNVIFRDQNLKRISVPLNSFSLKSQEAIIEELKSR
ncbi:hypothetical protein N9Z53_00755 [Mariniblastus sp.]|nr:hypothetical protein [Mariniblastus sp.]